MKSNWIRYLIVVIFLTLSLGTAYAQGGIAPSESSQSQAAKQIQQAQDLVEAGKSAEAYALLQPMESEQAGTNPFDYLLGISALNSGKASQAVFALERAQATNPNYGDVNLWLAIAYRQSGNMERAKSGFNTILAQSQNPATKSRANEYLDLIKKQEDRSELEEKKAAGSYLQGNIELGMGHDSNITSSTTDYLGGMRQAFNLPDNTLTPALNRAAKLYILNLGVEGRIPFASGGTYAFASLDDGKRAYNGNSVMNSDMLVIKGGVGFASNGNTYKINLARQEFRQEGTAADPVNDYTSNGLDGDTRLMLTAYDYLGFMAQYNQMRFQTNNSEDTNQTMLGTSYMHIFHVNGSPVFYLGYTRIDDKAVRTKTSYVPTYNSGITLTGRTTDNLALYAQYSVTDKIDIFSTGYVSIRKDSAPYARAATVMYGKDDTRSLTIGVNWRPVPLWTVRTLVSKTTDDSNISLYSYQRIESSITVKREFR